MAMTKEKLIKALKYDTGRDYDLDSEIAKLVTLEGNARWRFIMYGVAPPYTDSMDEALSLAGNKTVAVLMDALSMIAEYYMTFSDHNDHIKKALPRFVVIAALKRMEPVEPTYVSKGSDEE